MDGFAPDGPAFFPGIVGPNGRLAFLCKGGGSAQASKDAAAARRQSLMFHRENMKLSRQQMRMAAAANKPIEYLPGAAQATASVDQAAAGLDYRRKAAKRFGTSSTIMAAGSGIGGSTALAS